MCLKERKEKKCSQIGVKKFEHFPQIVLNSILLKSLCNSTNWVILLLNETLVHMLASCKYR